MAEGDGVLDPLWSLIRELLENQNGGSILPLQSLRDLVLAEIVTCRVSRIFLEETLARGHGAAIRASRRCKQAAPAHTRHPPIGGAVSSQRGGIWHDKSSSRSLRNRNTSYTLQYYKGPGLTLPLYNRDASIHGVLFWWETSDRIPSHPIPSQRIE